MEKKEELFKDQRRKVLKRESGRSVKRVLERRER